MTHRSRATTLALASLLCAPHAASPQTPPTPQEEIEGGPARAMAAPTETPPRVDGRLDEAAWMAAPLIDGFVQREPREGEPASERTEVRILYDADALYLGAWLFDSDPAGIVIGETRRDAELGEVDALLLILDTYHDRQNGFVFGTTPAGVEYDGQVTREGQGGYGGQARQQAGSGGGFNKNWDGSWDVATSRDDRGWYAEFRIPFSTLRYGAGGPQTWGLNIARNIRRRNEEVFWSPIPRQYDLYRVSQAGTLEGFQAPARRSGTVTPYVLGSGRRDYLTGSDPEADVELGGDAKIGITPSLTLDLTYNTDFAQVEVDEEQVNLTRFRLFFPEKRPFFLENAGVFSVGTPQEVELFFSRRIGIESGREVPIVAGGRLTGRAGSARIGILSIQTEGASVPDTLRPGGRVEFAAPTNYSVARILRELANRSQIGAVAVSRTETGDLDDHHFTYGVDGRWGIGSATTISGYAAGTTTALGDEQGYAYSLSGDYTTRDWRIGAAFREVSEEFDPQVGFVARSGYRFASARVLRALRFEGIPWLREVRPHVTYREWFAPDGFSETGLLHIDSHFEFSNGAFFQLPAFNLTREGLKEPFQIAEGVVVAPGTYDNAEWGFAYNTDRSARFSAEGRIDIGGFYSGRRAGTASTFNMRMGENLVAGLRLTHYDVHLREGDFQTSLVGLRAAYSFTPRIYLQSLVQYNDQTEQFSSNLRFGWLNTAGTGLFIVYNDTERADLFDRHVAPAGPIERTLVIKFTRQFDLGL